MFLKSKPRVRFLARSDVELECLPKPVPASKALPDYFRAIAPTTDGRPMSSTVKRCVPFLDAMTQGFIIPLWTDLYVTAKEGNMTLSPPAGWSFGSIIESHSLEQIPGHPLENLPYGRAPMKFMNPWTIQTAPGWSCLITSPLNHMETRVKILDGVVDTDTYYNPINLPFVWTEGDGEFMLRRGTPLAQVIPFRRERTEMEVSVVDQEKIDIVRGLLGTVHEHAYRRFFWSKRREA